MNGNLVESIVCIDEDICAEDFSYLYITSSSGIFNEQISGIVGLARPRSFMIAPDENEVDNDRLIMHATQSSAITLSFGEGAAE